MPPDASGAAASLPRVYADEIGAFLAAGLTGNITIHVRAGETLGLTIEKKFQKRIDRAEQKA